MSDLKKYECTVLIDASCGVTVEASSPEEAAELAENQAAEQGAGSLCHQCSGHTECGDSYAVIVYEDDKEVLDTDHRSKLLTDALSQLAALREELARVSQSWHDMKQQSDIDKQRLAGAERRNAELIELLRDVRDMPIGGSIPGSRIDAALNPNPEAATSEAACTCWLQPQEPQCTDCPNQSRGTK